MILDEVLNELFGFGEKKPEKQAYKGSIGKPFPGTKKDYDYALRRYMNNKNHKYEPVEYLYELYVFPYTEKMCIEIANHNKESLSEIFYHDGEKEILSAIEFFNKNKLGELCTTDGFGYMYSPGTKKWYEYDHEATPQVNPHRPLSFQSVMNAAKKEYEEFMKEYSID